MNIKYRIYYLWQKISHPSTIRMGYRAIVSMYLVTVSAGLMYTITYLWPSSQSFSYASQNCVGKTTLLPRLHKIDSPSPLSTSFSRSTHIGNYPVLSRAVCTNLVQTPAEHTVLPVTIRPLGNPLAKHTTNFTVADFPKLQDPTRAMSGTISTKDSLQFELSQADDTFSYQLANDKTATSCTKHGSAIRCDVSKLNLMQAQSYTLRVDRYFAEKFMSTLFTNKVQTVTPITVLSSSIKASETVYTVPANISIAFDKPLARYEGVRMTKADGTEVPITTTHKDSQLVVAFKDRLPRGESFTLHVQSVTATDQGFLSQPFSLSFSTSGGPKVIQRSIGNYDVAPNSSIRLTFDVAIKPETAAQFIQLNGASGPIPVKTSVSGNIVTLIPDRNFGRCESFTVKVLDGIESMYGISGKSAYQHAARSTCRTTFSIGSSVEGRSIVAYSFGSGPSKILYVGGTHGNEMSSTYILNSWVNHLESVAPNIPANRTIIIIPTINPDGFARSERVNARGVDLNRNFPANNWKADVTIPGGQLVIGGGGSSALSEPESAALAAYTQAIQPRLVLTYHAKGSIVTANESGDSMALATLYGKKTGYWAVAESQLGGTFNYDTTGAYENWLHDKVGITALLIELPGHTSNYFRGNLDAMWAMATLQ